jgi:hypothetical protein
MRRVLKHDFMFWRIQRFATRSELLLARSARLSMSMTCGCRCHARFFSRLLRERANPGMICEMVPFGDQKGTR